MAEALSSVSFAESVYALSKVVHVVKFRNDISHSLTEHQRKHLRLLDDIALFLVTESNSDVAAVSLERLSGGVSFHYAKNRPVTQADQDHIEALLHLLRGDGTPIERIEKMLHKVMIDCRPKLLSRLSKLQVTLRENQSAPEPYLHDDRHGELHDYYRSNFGDWYDKYPTAAEFLTESLAQIANWDPAKNQTDVLLELLCVAHVTGSYKRDPPPGAAPGTKQPEPIFIDPMLSQRVRLLGDYYGAAKRMVKHYDFAAEHQSGEVDIKFIPAPVAPQLESTMPKDYVKILNRFATDRNLPKATYDTLVKAFPHRTPPPPPRGKRSQSVRQSVHAECTLAVYLASLGRQWTNIEIGCSKGSCWLCESYLSLNQAGLSFHVRNVHGKLQPGWTIPEDGDPRVEKYIRRLVEDQLVEVMHKAHNPKRGDSHPRSESDEDEKKKGALIGKFSWARS